MGGMAGDWEPIVKAIAQDDDKMVVAELNGKLNNDTKAISSLVDALKRNSNLTAVLISGNGLPDTAVTQIITALLENNKSKVKQLDLSSNQVTEASTEIVENLRKQEVNVIVTDNPIEGALRKKRRGRKRKKAVSKSRDKIRRPSDPVDESDFVDARKQILDQRLKTLQAKEVEYQSQIEELETRVKELSRGKLSILNNVFSRKKSKTAMTVSTKSIIVTQKISEGGGSSAEIYSCLVDGWSVVMKELSTSSMSQTHIDSFSREIRLLELLPPHANIVRYLFHEVKDNFLRLFMTQYDCSLTQYYRSIKEQGERIPIKTILKILLDIIRGLEFLHAQNIMHRDLKSDNIFVLYGERKEIQLCAIGDFDTAKQVSNTKTVLGTPSWMAPEVMAASSEEGYSFPCDIYSFSMIIYELLTLQIPFSGENPMKIPMLVMQGQRPDLPTDLPSEYEILVNLYQQCSVQNPEERPLPTKIKTTLALCLANH